MFSLIFNKKIGEIMEILDVSGNEALKRSVKKKLWDLSDELQELSKNTEESNNGKEQTFNR